MPQLRQNTIVKGTYQCKYCNKAIGENVTNNELRNHLINDCDEIGTENRKMLALEYC